MARAAAPMLRGFRADTSTTRNRSSSDEVGKNGDFTTRRWERLLESYRTMWFLRPRAIHWCGYYVNCFGSHHRGFDNRHLRAPVLCLLDLDAKAVKPRRSRVYPVARYFALGRL